MTHELKKTLAFAAAALVMLALAWTFNGPRDLTAEEFTQDQGQPFFPDFTDPRAAQALEVIDFDPDTASAIPFKVEYEAGKGWVIPSHKDYPADARDRLAKTAAGVIDLKKDVIVSDDAEQHEDLGVVDPLDTKSTALKGRGKRVTLKDGKGQVLADLIVGKAVPSREGQRYVRVPGQKRAYAVNMNVDLSAKFGDWIETNLLKVDASKVTRITIDNHKVDPEQGIVQPGGIVTIERENASDPWTLEGAPLGPERELDTARIATMTSALADLKIVGVRPKPPGLAQQLKATADEANKIPLSRQSLDSLAQRGFYKTRDGRLLSNQGDIYAATDDGILYILQFGEVVISATGEGLTAGTGEDEALAKQAGAAKKEGEPETKTAGDNRYLLVMAQFDPTLIAKPESMLRAEREAAAAGEKPELPDRVFARTAEEIQADEAALRRDREDYERRVAEGKKKAADLTNRFAGWYYVVPGEAFRSIVVDRAGLTRDKTPAGGPPGGGLPPGMTIPGMNGGGLPPGFNMPR
jgi:hypothetical protein